MRIPTLALFLSLPATACNPDLLPPVVGTPGGGQPPTPPPTECSPTGAQLVMRGPFDVTSRAMKLIRGGDLDGTEGAITGVFGGSADGEEIGLWRDGDVGDGDLGEVRRYDVGRYPHNMSFVKGPTVAECWQDGVTCPGFFAGQGFFEVTEVRPVYRARFRLEGLREGGGEEPGAPLPGVVEGCLAIPNP